MSSKHMKMYTTSLHPKEMLNKMKYHIMLTKMSKIRKADNTKCWQVYAAIRILVHCW